MTAVPQKVLNWLYSVLTSEYHDVNRTYNDVAQALAHHNALSPRTDVYTFENGASALLVHLSGTLPVSFRGTTYRFPIDVWVPHAYPREAPLIYVTPTQGMVVRPGQHVSGDGRVYHPYLARWHEFWDKSNILDFVSVLSGVFAKEPPLVAKRQPEQPPPPQQQTSAPPPIPPLPSELQRPASERSSSQSGPSAQTGPPPPPPKPHGQQGDGYVPNDRQYRRGSSEAPPPLPQKPVEHTRGAPSPGSYGMPTASRQSSASYYPNERQPPLPPGPGAGGSREPFSPVGPPPPNGSVHGQPLSYNQQPQQNWPPGQPPRQSGMPPGYTSPPQTYQSQPPPNPPQSQQNQYPPHHQYPPQPWQQPWQQPGPPQGNMRATQANQRAPAPAPMQDLLSLPTQPSEPLPAPPIPPNPEKDSLLHSLSHALHAHRQQSLSRTAETIPSLHAQHAALQASTSAVQQELHALETLDAQLSSNERILADSTRAADKVMVETREQRHPPAVDEVLVAPTVVGEQLYAVVAEERALGDALAALHRALDRGRVSAEVFARQTRGLARERFLKVALERKIARGMGLGLE